jgi:hypothetical protein
MHAAGDAGKRKVPVQMGGRGDRDGVNAALKQFLDRAKGRTAERATDGMGLPAVRVRDARELYRRKLRQHARMICAHHPDTHHADAYGLVGVDICRLQHRSPQPKSIRTQRHLSPKHLLAARLGKAGLQFAWILPHEIP